MKKSLSILICTFFLLSIVVAGCSYTGLYKYSKNLNEYNINLVFNQDNYSLKGTEIVNYINNTDIVLENVDFHLYPNAFRNEDSTQKPVSAFNFNRAYPNGFDSGYIDILSVKLGNNNCEYFLCENENTILSTKLIKKLYPSERVEITIEFEIKIPNVNHRFGYGENTVNIGNFYPIACVYENGGFVHDGYHYNGDPFYSEMANYNVKITYPSTFTLASTGECKGEKTTNENTTKNITATVVRDFAFVLSKKFITLDGVYKKVNIYYMYYNDQAPDITLKLIKDTLKTFNSLIGTYPYTTLTIVQSNFIHGGMEFPNLVLISDEIDEKDEYLNVVVHEIAHQWFYNIIGNNEVSEAWLDEGLTEYVTLMFFELNSEYNISYDELLSNMLNSYLLFVDVYKDIFGDIDTTMDRNLSEFNSEYEYTYMVYVKSVLMLDNLREVMGDANFCLGLKTYYENNKFKIAKKEHFIRDFGKVSTMDISGLINSWIDGNVEITGD